MLTILEVDAEKGITYIVSSGVAFVNCTPHPVIVYTSPDSKLPVIMPTSGFVARAGQMVLAKGDVAGIPLFELEYDADDGTQPGDFPVCQAWIEKGLRVVYIVSLRFIQVLGDEYKYYPILYTPGPAKRYNDGTQIGCVGLCMQVGDNTDDFSMTGILKPDWTKAPAWANYFAVDEDDVACWFSHEPKMVTNPDEDGFWGHAPNTQIKSYRHGHFGIPWQLTLRQRPTEEK